MTLLRYLGNVDEPLSEGCNVFTNDYSPISDTHLDEMVENVASLHPKCGKKTVNG